ncbi:MAG: hypothetical protein IPF69_06705 [Chitinophagaceae bacterium]|nr:hypothetical protein [Chitinophagaceae bacterium]
MKLILMKRLENQYHAAGHWKSCFNLINNAFPVVDEKETTTSRIRTNCFSKYKKR